MIDLIKLDGVIRKIKNSNSSVDYKCEHIHRAIEKTFEVISYEF